jgi:hypothetical protein
VGPDRVVGCFVGNNDRATKATQIRRVTESRGFAIHSGITKEWS